MPVQSIYSLLDLLDDSPLALKYMHEKILHIQIRRPLRILSAGKHRRRPALEIEKNRFLKNLNHGDDTLSSFIVNFWVLTFFRSFF
ncbi:hypothetical protein EUTSA_v10016043mg [Eutrema salsugineum]|uniref:Uncharacterized protein n=1 Tax=Eutrema salsugineum TaxID=72664 RepID=V4NAJ8_EUTSA|nr:hypothetical protein EUTSA_v10016043mg [Eutrema salsugineum]